MAFKGKQLCSSTWQESNDAMNGACTQQIMMFHAGSPRIGTKDYATEAPILEAMDEGKAFHFELHCNCI